MACDSSAKLPLGTVVVERSILRALQRLWTGPIDPDDLKGIELGVRALLTSEHLIAAQPWDSRSPVSADASDYEPPFGDNVLDYEFIHPDDPIMGSLLPALGSTVLSQCQSGYLEEFVASRMRDKIRQILQRPFQFDWQAMTFLENWSAGEPVWLCEESSRFEDYNVYFELNRDSFDLELFLAKNKYRHVLADPVHIAKDLVTLQRAGLMVYADSPVGELCAEFIFSEWPQKLFEEVGQEFQNAARQIRGPGIAIDLPPLTALLLSRASCRENILTCLRDLRDEYAKPRKQLWGLLNEMWETPFFKDQLKILVKLQGASKSVFKAAFPERFDILSLGLDIAQMSPGAIARVGQKLLERDLPRSRVSAVSLAAKLSKDLRNVMLNSRVSLQRHLSKSELRDFGFA